MGAAAHPAPGPSAAGTLLELIQLRDPAAAHPMQELAVQMRLTASPQLLEQLLWLSAGHLLHELSQLVVRGSPGRKAAAPTLLPILGH